MGITIQVIVAPEMKKLFDKGNALTYYLGNNQWEEDVDG